MDVFGPQWIDHHKKIASHWKKNISKNDLVLLPGDISWAMHLQDALIDLNWINTLPGTKIMIRGNHDYWWPSLKKLNDSLPPTIHAIHNNCFLWNDIAIAGTRLWDSPEYNFANYIEFTKNPFETTTEKIPNEKIFFSMELVQKLMDNVVHSASIDDGKKESFKKTACVICDQLQKYIDGPQEAIDERNRRTRSQSI